MTKQGYTDKITKHLTERYRSGHNEAVLKTVCPQGRVGSNPTLSAGFMLYVSGQAAYLQLLHILQQYKDGKRTLSKTDSAEVPKRLKGLPWKGSRLLIAVRGFKSLLLR